MKNKLFNTKTLRILDQAMIQNYVPSAYDLMTQAAQSVFDVILERYPGITKLVIFCGQGNNAGDGYVLARLALKNNVTVSVISLVDTKQLSGDALIAYNDWSQIEETHFDLNDTTVIEESINNTELIVDAILGTGLDRPLSPNWNKIISCINQRFSVAPVVAIDIPSGLDADTGFIWGETIKADITVTFIAKKQGMYTGQAANYCGDIIFKSLAVPESLYQQYPNSATLLSWEQLKQKILPRHAVSHKGNYGNVLIIGGNISMPGAVMLAGQSALRSGVGLVKILTHSENVFAIQANHAELMVHGVDDNTIDMVYLNSLLDWADSVAIGPGLGTNNWAMSLLQLTFKNLNNSPEKPLIIDADGLNLLANNNNLRHANLVITPHPGEAARLLNYNIKQIEQNRYASIQQLQYNYKAIVVLKPKKIS
jgi:ADP-dependent NAD(P)H-hydrate dehydratase / NAD(P)H-hydrate epimerase